MLAHKTSGSRAKTWWFVVAALIALASACTDDRSTSGESARYLQDELRARGGAATRNVWYRTLDELLPNVQFAAPGESPDSITDTAIVGEIVEVTKGRGFVVNGADSTAGMPVEFDRRDARWKTVHLTVRANQLLAGHGVPSTIEVGVALDGSVDFNRVAQGFKELGTVVLFLYKNSPVFSYDPRLYSIVEDGTLLVVVDQRTGELSLPGVDGERAKTLLGTTSTLDALERRAKAAPYTILLRVDGNQRFR